MRIAIPVLVFSFLFCTGLATAQVGIGTTTPDTSSALDVRSTTKGFLLPKMTTVQRDAMGMPATGLLVYNNTVTAVQVNKGTPVLPAWTSIIGRPDTIINSITASNDLSTTSLLDTIMSGMTLSPPAGTYLVLFNTQYGISAGTPVTTQQAAIDLQSAYDAVAAIPATSTTHAAVFGNGETLMPGVYTIPAAGSIAGNLTLDAGGDSNAVFIVRAGGAFNSGAGSTVILANGARSRNIFFVAEGALGLAANTIMKGTLISHNAAISAGAGVNLEGRLFSTAGAAGFGPATVAIPTGPSAINLGVLSTFAIFTSAGAVGNTGPSNITGNVGSNAGAITGFGTFNGQVYMPGGTPDPVNNTLATFSIYRNGVMVPFSSRTVDVNTSTVSLQAMATIATGQTIDIRWKVDAGPLSVGNRIMTLISVH